MNLLGPTKKRTASSATGTGSTRKNTTSTVDKVSVSNTQNQNSFPEAQSVENNQPDVIKVASAANKNVSQNDIALAVSKDIANLQKQNEELDCQLKHHALGFNAMATCVDYLANHCGVVGVMEYNNQLQQDVTRLQHTVEKKRQEIGR